VELGYNTNGLAHHDLVEAIDLLAEIGYASVAITLDHGLPLPKAVSQNTLATNTTSGAAQSTARRPPKLRRRITARSPGSRSR